MNYYPHHIGDYLKGTAHLTMIEDGAYRRLLDLYYQHEQPLPKEKKQIFRLARAASKNERDAVLTILDEYFYVSDDGWRHRRCDKEIAKSIEKSEKAKASAEKRWQNKDQKTQGNAHSKRNANASANAMRTHSEGNAYPITNNQEPIEVTTTNTPEESREPPGSSSSPPITDEAPTRQSQIAMLLRRNGADPATHPGSKGIQAMLDLQATDAQILNALETAKQQRKNAGSTQPVTAAYLLPIVRQLQATPPPGKPATRAQRLSDWNAEMAAVIAQADTQQPREIDMGVIDATDHEN